MMPSENRVLIAIELSVSSWFVAVRLPGSEKSRLHRVEGGDTTALLALIRDLRSRAETKLRHAADVACCFEAGRDGFWLHRLLTAHGAIAYVLEPTSILVNRRARRAKSPFEKSLNAVCGRDSSLGCGPQQRAAEWPRSRRRPNGIRAT